MRDDEIIASVLEGDTEGYAVLVRRHHRDLLGFVYRIVRDPHLAEDIGQEAFLDAYKSLSRFDPSRGAPFFAWLCVLARNRAVSALRKRMRGRADPAGDAALAALAGDPGPEALLIGREEAHALCASVEKLEEPFKSALLASLTGQPVADIARTSGVSAATVKSRLFRARERLKGFVAAQFSGVCHERKL